jgi:hypothetical protein
MDTFHPKKRHPSLIYFTMLSLFDEKGVVGNTSPPQTNKIE